MKKYKLPLLSGLVGVGMILSAGVSQAQAIYTSGHGDLGVEYTPGEAEFEAHWHIGSGAVVDGVPLTEEQEFAPEALAAQLGTQAAVSSSAVASALGVSTGTMAFRTGNAAYPPNVGFGLEEVGSDSEWQDGSITLTLTGWTGPGSLAVSQTIANVGTFVWFSSDASKTQNSNAWDFGVGGHQHLDWWFSEAGNYSVTFTWTGTYIGGESPVAVSGSGTYEFQAVPEPGTWALLGVAMLIGMAVYRRRVLPVS